jgi:radical SAM protein with 4Fe4S-binding SPASM domain
MLNKEYIPLIIDLINRYNIENVTIGGGEPLTWPHLRNLLTEILEKTNAKIFLLTNGLLLDKIEDILTTPRFNVQISLDAVHENTYQKVRGGNFRKLLKNVAKLKNAKTDIALSYTLHSYNKDEVIKFIKYSEKIGINFIHFPIIENYGRAKINQLIPFREELIDLYQFLVYYSLHYNKVKIYFVEEIKFRLLNQLKRYNCSALYNQLSLGPDGYLYPCSELINDKFKICHITESEKLRDYIHLFRSQTGFGSPIVQKICPNCPIKYLCGGGCRAVDLLSGKNYFEAQADSLTCDIFLKSVFTILWELANYKLDPKVPINLLYSNKVLKLVKEHEKLD